MSYLWKHFIFGGLILMMLGQTCRLNPPGPQNLDELTPAIIMSKGPCYGSCPVFTLTIYDNKLVAFKGERYTSKPGLWTRKLAGADFDRLMQAFREANLWKYPSAFKSQVPDLPTVTITFYDDGDSKEIKGKDGRPEVVLALEDMLDRVANSSGWAQLEEDENQTGDGDRVPVSTTIDNEIIVELAQDVDPNVWAIKFAKQQMRVVKKVSPIHSYYLVSFDAEKATLEQMLLAIRRDRDVLSAEMNKRVGQRN